LLSVYRVRQESGSGELPAAAISLREPSVGDVSDEVLEKAALAVLGRAWIRLQADDLLAHERLQERLELLALAARERCERLLRESLPEHGGILEQSALGLRQTV